MPFWWRRRRKPWFGRRRYRRRFQRYQTRRRRRRRPTTRRSRRTTRRRRRRHQKVRRKKKKLILTQWQPDSIKKCKIKGLGCIVAGAYGTNMYCYTNERELYPQPKAPGGGGFGCEVYKLQYLYRQWKAHKNIWTASNDYKDLCRYTGCKIQFFRHADTDFIIRYHRQPPFDITKTTYTDIHPVNMLLSKHHKVVLSRKTRPNAKQTVTVRIKPPKQMINKWFFQEEFTKYDLLQLDAVAANMEYPIYGKNTQNSNLTLYALNIKFYQNHNWQKDISEHAYIPYPTYPTTSETTYTYPQRQGTGTYTFKPTTYYPSIDYTTGFFNWRVLQATSVINSGHTYSEKPVTVIRYNPDKDTGENNIVYVVSITSTTQWRVPTDKDLYIVEKPLWMALHGMWNYILIRKKTPDFFKYHMFVVKSPAIELISKTEQVYFPLIDLNFLQGKLPYDEFITEQQKKLWYPTAYMQVQSLNNLVISGPYTPKYYQLPSSTWNLTYKYTFYFKWGGPTIEDQPVQNPEDQGKYPVPDTLTKAIQISNPLKQHCKAMFRAWDYRRGILTKTAIKRMSEHLPAASIISSDDSEPQQKRKRTTAEIQDPEDQVKEIQECLLSLCEKDSYQEEAQEENLLHLIQQQHQQQQKLKLNLIKLLTDLKCKQRLLQLHTGVH
uniref:Capsid protein n=1 Tax=Gammatorquevirus homidi8 TaxID=3048393 RepID=A0AAU7STC3_9VIRU